MIYSLFLQSQKAAQTELGQPSLADFGKAPSQGTKGNAFAFPFSLWIFSPYSGLVTLTIAYDSLTISNAVAGSHKVCVLKIQGNGPSYFSFKYPKAISVGSSSRPHSIHSEGLF